MLIAKEAGQQLGQNTSFQDIWKTMFLWQVCGCFYEATFPTNATCKSIGVGATGSGCGGASCTWGFRGVSAWTSWMHMTKWQVKGVPWPKNFCAPHCRASNTHIQNIGRGIPHLETSPKRCLFNQYLYPVLQFTTTASFSFNLPWENHTFFAAYLCSFPS